MLLVTLSKRPRIKFYRSHEFNLTDRPKFFAIQILFLSIMFLDERSDIRKVFNSAYNSSHEFAWDVKFNTKVNELATKKADELFKDKLDDFNRLEEKLSKTLKERDELLKNKDSVGITARAIKRFYLDNIKGFED